MIEDSIQFNHSIELNRVMQSQGVTALPVYPVVEHDIDQRHRDGADVSSQVTVAIAAPWSRKRNCCRSFLSCCSIQLEPRYIYI